MEPVFTVAICGGGNLAHGCVAAIGHHNPKFTINVLTRRPEVWSREIVGFTKGSSWESKGEIKGKINKCSNQARDVVPNADIILVCSPAHTKNEILKQIRPYIKESAIVGSVFGQGAFDQQCLSILGNDISQKNLTIFSLQYVPFICRAASYGSAVNIIGLKKMLYAASYPVDRVH